MIDAESYRCRASSPYAKSAQDFFCSAPTSPEVWSAIGSCAAALFAALAAIIAYRVYRKDKQRHRQQEIREATAGLIGAANDLIFQSDSSDRDNLADRSRVYQKSVIFELAALKSIDPARFNAAINWILKASGLRSAQAQPNDSAETNSRVFEQAHMAFLPRLVRELTESLRTYDLRAGKFDLVQDLVFRFDRVISEPEFINNEGILQSLVGQEKDYLNILLQGKEA